MFGSPVTFDEKQFRLPELVAFSLGGRGALSLKAAMPNVITTPIPHRNPVILSLALIRIFSNLLPSMDWIDGRDGRLGYTRSNKSIF